jgi:pilus assembly protein Flp/PilA
MTQNHRYNEKANHSSSSQPRQELSVMLFYSYLKGQGFVEYALIMLLVALIVIVVLALIGPYVGNMYSSVISGI